MQRFGLIETRILFTARKKYMIFRNTRLNRIKELIAQTGIEKMKVAEISEILGAYFDSQLNWKEYMK